MSICQDISDSDTESCSHEYAERSVAVYAWSLVKRGPGRGVCASCLTSPVDQDPLLETEARSYSDLAIGVTSGELDTVGSEFGRRRDTQQRSCWLREGHKSAVAKYLLQPSSSSSSHLPYICVINPVDSMFSACRGKLVLSANGSSNFVLLL